MERDPKALTVVRSDGLVVPNELETMIELFRQPGLDVFVSKASNRGRSMIMSGTRQDGWHPVLTCEGGDHAERASRYVDAYRALYRERQKP